MHKENKDIIVFYHANCPDGFGAAWAAWRTLGDTAEYHAYRHSTDLTIDVTGKQVYSLDLTFEERIFYDVIAKAASYTAIDHHESAVERTGKTKDGVYDPTHSGAVLSWKYFHPGTDVPLLLRYIEERDLWQYKLPHSQELSCSLALSEYSFEDWNKRAEDYEDPAKLAEHVREGEIILKKSLKDACEVAEDHYFIEFEGRKVPIVNSSGTVSDCGKRLAEKFPPFSMIWSRRKNMLTISFRGDGTLDVSQYATKYGGGGHPNAAGISIDIEKLNDGPETEVKRLQKELFAKLLSPSQL